MKILLQNKLNLKLKDTFSMHFYFYYFGQQAKNKKKKIGLIMKPIKGLKRNDDYRLH